MMDFKERKAEILCRAKKRIIRRKAIKNRLLAITIPLFICGVALSLIVSGGIVGNKSSNIEYPESVEDDFFADSNTDDFLADSITDWYIEELKVSDNNGLFKKYTADKDSERIEQITDIINSSFNTNSGGGVLESSTATTTAPNDNEQNDEVKTQNSITEYKIEMIDSLSEKTVFILKVYKLINTETGDAVTLSNAKRNTLLKNFGLGENE